MKQIRRYLILLLLVCGVAGSEATSYVSRDADEFRMFSELIREYADAHGGTMPENWAQIWNAEKIAYQQIKTPNRPLLYHNIFFIDEVVRLPAGVVRDFPASRIIAVSATPFESRMSEFHWVLKRGVVFASDDGKVAWWFVRDGELFRGVDLAKLKLRKPNLSAADLAKTVETMVEIGFEAKGLSVAMGKRDLEAVQSAGVLGSDWNPILSEAIAMPPVKSEAEKFRLVFRLFSPGMLAILGAVVAIVGVSVVAIRRKASRGSSPSDFPAR